MGPRRLTVLLPLGLAFALAGALLAGRILAWPDPAPPTTWEPEGGRRFQHALAELAMRAAAVSSRRDPVEVTAAELNAFLAHHVESRRLPFRPLVVTAGENRLVIAGRSSPARLSEGSWIEPFVERLPRAARELDLWLSVRGQLVVRAGEAELAVEEARVGRQRVPTAWLWRVVGLDPREQLRWRLPRVVEAIETRPGRVIVHTRHPGG